MPYPQNQIRNREQRYSKRELDPRTNTPKQQWSKPSPGLRLHDSGDAGAAIGKIFRWPEGPHAPARGGWWLRWRSGLSSGVVLLYQAKPTPLCGNIMEQNRSKIRMFGSVELVLIVGVVFPGKESLFVSIPMYIYVISVCSDNT